MFCFTHKTFYTFGDCPKCADAQVRAQAYGSAAAITNRWAALQANPDQIDQDQFGVCGTTSIVYLLLRYNPARAIQLFNATFADLVPAHAGTQFTTANGQQVRIKFKYLTRRYWVKEQEAQQEAQSSTAVRAAHRVMMTLAAGQVPAQADQDAMRYAVNQTTFADFCVSRALGYVFKKTAENRYSGEKVQFNTVFDPAHTHNYRNVTHKGSLALRTNNLAFILKEIVGALNVHVVSKSPPAAGVGNAPPVPGVPVTQFTTLAQLQNAFANGLARPNSFAIAGIYADIVQNGHVGAASAGKAGLAYDHWIVINGFTPSAAGAKPACPSAHIDINIWTWANNWTAEICSAHVLSYIQDVVFGHF